MPATASPLPLFQLNEWLGHSRIWPKDASIELQTAFKLALDVPDRYRRLIPDSDMPVAQLIGSALPAISTARFALPNDNLFSKDDPLLVSLVIIQEDVPPLTFLLKLHNMLKQKWLDGHCSLNKFMHDAIEGRNKWIRARDWYCSHIGSCIAPNGFAYVKPAIELLFSVLGWNSKLNRSTNFTTMSLIPLFSRGMISGTLVDTVMVMFNSWARSDPATQSVKFETLDFQYPFLRDDLDWSLFDMDDPLQLSYLRSVRDSIQAGLFNILICPLHVGDENHFVTARLDLRPPCVLAYGDSLDLEIELRDFEGFDQFVDKVEAGTILSSEIKTLSHLVQDDGFSCAVVTWNTCEHVVWPGTQPWQSGVKDFARIEYALLLATHNDSSLTLLDLGLPETFVQDRHSFQVIETPSLLRNPSISHFLDSPDSSVTQHPSDPDFAEHGEESQNELESDMSCSPADVPTPTLTHTQRQQSALQTDLLSYFAVISRDEAERRRLATREQRFEEDTDRTRMAQQHEALKKIAKAEKIKIQNCERQRNKRQRDRAQKDTRTRLMVNDVLLPSCQEDPSNEKTAELSRPRRLFKEDAAENRDVRGQKHEHKATDAKLNNWNQYPDIVEVVVKQLTLLCQAGISVHVRITRGIMLAHTEHGAPELLHAIANDGSQFRCTDSYVRKFLYQHLCWVPRQPTKAPQSTPSNAEEQIWQLFLRLALLLRDAGIWHPELVANFDQTQVIVADNGSCTFEVEGSKQVAVTSKEEKRAWTAMVGVTAAGNVLPMQIVMKGGSQHSLPSSNSLDYAESKELGLLFRLNAKNYWSNISLLEEYLKKIVTPHFSMQKQRLGYPEDQECVVLLDCWSVHRSEKFRNLVRCRWPWLRLRYIPGGCTGLAQPCDVRIQQPYKLSIKRSQLDDIISETLAHLESNGDPMELKLDSCIGTLRDRSVAWFVKAWKEINQVELMKKSDNVEVVADTALADDEDPFLDDADDDGDDTALEPNVLMVQILSEPVSADCLLSATDTPELEEVEVQISDPEEFGHGKCQKTASKKYQGFEHH
ncbi:hypothetical protein EWM64_g7638 [Hericium alpestre]|uniref:DDE-1 domain-containing protein n=1 Tax=Hericium alpestre TaxID=135208 RepID=A0A4Y9ZQR8_9AGAM|nr:hypothetical protein EWM64_g7638 [Hericium alpestre]